MFVPRTGRLRVAEEFSHVWYILPWMGLNHEGVQNQPILYLKSDYNSPQSHIIIIVSVVFPCESTLKLTLLHLWGELNAPLLSKGRMPARSKVKWKKKHRQKNATSVFHACQKWSGQTLITLTVVCALDISLPPPIPFSKELNETVITRLDNITIELDGEWRRSQFIYLRL